MPSLRLSGKASPSYILTFPHLSWWWVIRQFAFNSLRTLHLGSDQWPTQLFQLNSAFNLLTIKQSYKFPVCSGENTRGEVMYVPQRMSSEQASLCLEEPILGCASFSKGHKHSSVQFTYQKANWMTFPNVWGSWRVLPAPDWARSHSAFSEIPIYSTELLHITNTLHSWFPSLLMLISATCLATSCLCCSNVFEERKSSSTLH